MKRDFRYLSVTESSTDWLAICILLVDGVYMKITKEIKDKTKFKYSSPALYSLYLHLVNSYFSSVFLKLLFMFLVPLRLFVEDVE